MQKIYNFANAHPIVATIAGLTLAIIALELAVLIA